MSDFESPKVRIHLQKVVLSLYANLFSWILDQPVDAEKKETYEKVENHKTLINQQ